MKKCPSLYGYMRYVEKIRYYRTSYSLEKAVQMAVDECISEGILVDFLKENKAGVVAMSIFEYDEELHFRTLREEGREEGQILKLITQICRKLSKNKLPETIAEELEEDLSFVETVCEVAKQFAPEYNAEEIYEKLYIEE